MLCDSTFLALCSNHAKSLGTFKKGPSANFNYSCVNCQKIAVKKAKKCISSGIRCYLPVKSSVSQLTATSTKSATNAENWTIKFENTAIKSTVIERSPKTNETSRTTALYRTEPPNVSITVRQLSDHLPKIKPEYSKL